MPFTVLLYEEAAEMGVQVDWNAAVTLTSKMRADKNSPDPSEIFMKGRLLEPFVLGQQTIPAGSAVFMDRFGEYFIDS
jgi:hypothetical protein